MTTDIFGPDRIRDYPPIQRGNLADLLAQLAGKQPLDTDLTAIAALSTTVFGRSLLTQATNAAARAALDVWSKAEGETPAGAQSKATTALNSAKDYTDDEVAALVASEGWIFADQRDPALPLVWDAAATYPPRTVVERSGGWYVSTSTTTGDDPALGGPWKALPTAVDADFRAEANAKFAQVFAVDADTYGEGVGDATAHIQARIDAAAVNGGMVYIPFGVYVISATLVVPHGVSIEGGFGGYSGLKPRYPELRWFGTADIPMVETNTLGGTELRGFQPFRKLVLRGNVTATLPSHGLVIHDRCDSFALLEDFQVLGVNGDAVIFEKGGLNVWIKRFRCDQFGGVGIRFNPTMGDSLSVDDFTITQLGTTLTYHDSAMEFDFTTAAATSSAFLVLYLKNGKMEFAKNRPPGRGTFQFTIAPATYVKHWVMAEFDSVWSAPNADVTGKRDINVSPAADGVSFVLSNCMLDQITGIPSYKKSPQGTGSKQPFQIIAPHTKAQQALPNTDEHVSQIAGAFDIEELFAYGVRASPIIHGTTATLPSGTTIYPGTWLFEPAQAGTRRVLQECTGVGTVGTLSGVTGTAASGAQEVTVNDATNIRAGQRLRFTGIAGIYRVIRVQYPEKIVTLSAGLMSAASNTEVTYAAPALASHDVGGGQRHTGAGTPEGVVTAPVGSTFQRTDGGAGTTFYVKEPGGGNTGWVAK